MANRRVEDEIERLGQISQESAPPVLRKALADRVGLVVAKAAKMTAAFQLQELVPDLLRAFDRMFEKPTERDPQCWAKNAIAQALIDLGHRESAAFLRGAHWVQMEPVWGGQEDTASALRGICLLALPACFDVRREDVFRALVEGLTEPAQTVRLECVRAIAEMGGGEAALLLRLKARAGDAEPPVVGQAFDSLLQMEGGEAVPFVAAFLDSPKPEVAAEAALALGACRLEEAEALLEAAWQKTRNPDFRDVLLRALSASRQPRAFDFLVDLVKNARAADAVMALDALSIHRQTPDLWRRVEEAVQDSSPAIHTRFREIAKGGA
jgi:HEAT repeat protein